MTQEQAQGRVVVRVCEGDIVRVRFRTGEEHNVCIGSGDKKAVQPGVLLLSSGAPLSAALIGAALGAQVSYTVDGVGKSATILEISRS
jgi:transcription elongation GreA/GreB family factor